MTQLAKLEYQKGILKGRSESLAKDRRFLLKEISSLKMKLATTKHQLGKHNQRLELKVQKLKRTLHGGKEAFLAEKKKKLKKKSQKSQIRNRPKTVSAREQRSATHIVELQEELDKTRKNLGADREERKSKLKDLKIQIKNQIALLKDERKSAFVLLRETENQRRAVASQFEEATNKNQELSEFVKASQVETISLNSQMATLMADVMQLKYSLRQAKGFSSSSSYKETQQLIKNLRSKLVSEGNRNKRLECSLIEARY